MPPEVFLALDEALKNTHIEGYTKRENVAFWKGFAKAVEVMKKEIHKN